jgi:hypothetical protein
MVRARRRKEECYNGQGKKEERGMLQYRREYLNVQ